MDQLLSRTLRNMGLALVVGALSLVAPSAALGWANGPSQDGPGNGFGSHDWVLTKAIELAGDGAAWLDSDAAIAACDDPDTSLVRPDPLNHIYNLTRTGCGAPQRVGDLYFDATSAYAAGDTEHASVLIGQLSHYYSDICQPYHTFWDPGDPLVPADHLAYELAVDDNQRHAGDVDDWITPTTRKRPTDVRALTVAAALAARRDYPDLKRAMRLEGFVADASSATGRITRARLSRAANDLADIISAVPSGEGRAPTPTMRSLIPSNRTPRRATKVAMRTRIVDPAGRPIRAVRVDYEWRIGKQTARSVAYSEADGTATSWRSMADVPRGVRVVVVATARANGTSTSRRTTLRPR